MSKFVPLIAFLAVIAVASFYFVAPGESSQRQLLQTGFANHLLHDLFVQWKQTYGKVYDSLEEEALRFSHFIDNYKQIVAFNAEGNGAILGLNQFADLSSEEFGAQMGCLTEESFESLNNNPTVVFDTSSIPDSVDWRTKGAVTSVKNQATCGGCWAFAAAATLESLYQIKTNKTLTDFSPQQLIDCTSTCAGCSGCHNLYNALVYTSQYGIESWTDYPYTGVNGTCQYSKDRVIFTNKGYMNVTPKSVEQLKAAIAQQPVQVGIQANQLIFQFYAGGVIQKLCGDKMDHAVTAVGYGSYNGQDAFFVKNSWGQSWGVQGYVYISTNPDANSGKGVCGILQAPVYPTA